MAAGGETWLWSCLRGPLWPMAGSGVPAANLTGLLVTKMRRHGGIFDAEGDFKNQFSLTRSPLRWTRAQKGGLPFSNHADMVSPSLFQFLGQFLPNHLMN